MSDADNPDAAPLAALHARIRDLEARLEESEDTLEAIQRGDFDAVVVQVPGGARQVYTLESADRPYRVLIEQIQEGALTLSVEGKVLYCNERLAAMLDMPQERLVGQPLADFILPDDAPALAALLQGARTAPTRGELTLCSAGRSSLPVYFSLSVLRREEATPLFCGILTDLTEQKLHVRELSEANARLQAASVERERVEEVLRQSQKMEAVGQLTGGLAHDFNNLLAGISGSLELMALRIAQGRVAELDRYMVAAQGASRRAAALTHRLLAFSRRQTLDPRATDVNMLVSGMEDLIRRTVGPAVAIEVVGATGLWAALVDPPQLENALLNLCINARDAMPDGGRITIETHNKWLDDHAALTHDMPPGQYLALCVTDTGTGMSPDLVAKVFEPFFTTKPIGEGTGLGLSMIYGFARQSGGQVRIYSEVGEGTTVCIYLPRHYGEAAGADRAVPSRGTQARAEEGETVLVVDDEPSVRMLVTDVLEDLGYRALEASDSAAGLKILQSNARIDLLVTDVGLPGGLNGRQMADAGRVTRPELKVLFITGYAENAVLGNGYLVPGMQVLTKPFVLDILIARIRELVSG